MPADHTVFIRALSKVRMVHPSMTIRSDKDITTLTANKAYSIVFISSVLATFAFGCISCFVVAMWYWDSNNEFLFIIFSIGSFIILILDLVTVHGL